MSFGNLPTNIYELLGDEGEVAAPKTSSAPKQVTTQSQNRSQKPASDNRQPVRTGGNNRSGADRTPTSDNQINTERSKAPRGHKNPADGRKPKGIDQPRLDRRSGTGRGKEVSKGGHGKGSWGTPVTEGADLEQPTVAPVVAESEPEPVETAEEKEKREAEEKKREEERIKEEKQMTLEEYMQKKKAVSLGLPALRQPGEGATEQEKKQWASVPVTKPAEGSVSVPEKKAEAAVSEDKAIIAESSKKLAVFLDLGINVRVKDDARSRRMAQKWDEEKRRQDEDKDPKSAEDPKLKQKKKKGPYVKPPQITPENFPALSSSATKA